MHLIYNDVIVNKIDDINFKNHIIFKIIILHSFI